jgi:hypothetical protein
MLTSTQKKPVANLNGCKIPKKKANKGSTVAARKTRSATDQGDTDQGALDQATECVVNHLLDIESNGPGTPKNAPVGFEDDCKPEAEGDMEKTSGSSSTPAIKRKRDAEKTPEPPSATDEVDGAAEKIPAPPSASSSAPVEDEGAAEMPAKAKRAKKASEGGEGEKKNNAGLFTVCTNLRKEGDLTVTDEDGVQTITTVAERVAAAVNSATHSALETGAGAAGYHLGVALNDGGNTARIQASKKASGDPTYDDNKNTECAATVAFAVMVLDLTETALPAACKAQLNGKVDSQVTVASRPGKKAGVLVAAQKRLGVSTTAFIAKKQYAVDNAPLFLKAGTVLDCKVEERHVKEDQFVVNKIETAVERAPEDATKGSATPNAKHDRKRKDPSATGSDGKRSRTEKKVPTLSGLFAKAIRVAQGGDNPHAVAFDKLTAAVEIGDFTVYAAEHKAIPLPANVPVGKKGSQTLAESECINAMCTIIRACVSQEFVSGSTDEHKEKYFTGKFGEIKEAADPAIADFAKLARIRAAVAVAKEANEANEAEALAALAAEDK